jgi:RNA recognition motif-containing protein
MSRRVFVGNLSWEAAWQDLKDHMRGPAGELNVLHTEILMDGMGRSKGCAIVEFASPKVEMHSIELKISIATFSTPS